MATLGFGNSQLLNTASSYMSGFDDMTALQPSQVRLVTALPNSGTHSTEALLKQEVTDKSGNKITVTLPQNFRMHRTASGSYLPLYLVPNKFVNANTQAAESRESSTQMFTEAPPTAQQYPKELDGLVVETEWCPDYHSLPYFHGRLNELQSDALLISAGDFLLRHDDNDSLVLSVRRGAGLPLLNQVLKENAEGKYELPERPYADTVEEFINYYLFYEKPIDEGVHLRKPCKYIFDENLETAQDYEPSLNLKTACENVIVGSPLNSVTYYHGGIMHTDLNHLLVEVGDYLLRKKRDTGELLVSVLDSDKKVRNVRLPLTEDGRYVLLDRCQTHAPATNDAHFWCQHHAMNNVAIKKGCQLKRAINI